MSNKKTPLYEVRRSNLDAYSSTDGITVSSTEFQDVQKISAVTYYNEEGELESKILNQSIGITHRDYYQAHPEMLEYLQRSIFFVKSCSIGILLLISMLGNTMLTVFSIVFMVFCILTEASKSIPDYIADILYAHHFKSFSRYHSAEHMAAKASLKLGHAPSLEEIKSETRFDVHCTTASTISLMLTSLVDTFVLTLTSVFATKYFILAYTAVSSVLLHLLLAIAVVILIFVLIIFLQFLNSLIAELLKSEDFIKFFQQPILAKPSNIELALAEEAFRVQSIINQEIAEHSEEYETDTYHMDLDDKTTLFELNNGKVFKSTVDEYLDFILSIVYAQKADDDQAQE